jgi:hypothetical protein
MLTDDLRGGGAGVGRPMIRDGNGYLSEEISSRVAECTRLILVRMGLEET